MGDFFLDCRPPELRQTARAASLLKFCEGTNLEILERAPFALVVTQLDQPELWGSCSRSDRDGEILVALAGRVAMDAVEWEAARRMEGVGGLACRAICHRYRQDGVLSFEALNGNYVVCIFDGRRKQIHVVSDRCGMMICFHGDPIGESRVFSSHPDVLADALGESRRWDMTSLAQFVMTGCLTPPHSHYANIRAMEAGSIATLTIDEGRARHEQRRKYFRFDFQVERRASEWELAEELASGFKAAVRRRALPIFGKTAIALSGGLDSRAILSAVGTGEHIGAFTLFDKPNAELRVAERIAGACHVKLNAFARDPEYYGRTAELGVRISAGMGSVGSNHFLGACENIRASGFQNLLTGCHCDYLFKGLAFNTTEDRWLRTQKLAPFRFEFYRPHFRVAPKLEEAVECRLKDLFFEHARKHLTEEDWLEIERKRTFPLAYEGDLVQRMVPQRVLPWSSIVVDSELIRTYLKIPIRFKLNASIFRKMMTFVCPKAVLDIPDSNTGAAINSAKWSFAVRRCTAAILNRMSQRLLPGLHTRGSWLNWDYYVHHSPVVRDLWTRETSGAQGVLREIMGPERFRADVQDYRGRNVQLFVRLLTLKIWLDQRA